MNADVLHGNLYADEYNGNFCIANVTVIFARKQSLGTAGINVKATCMVKYAVKTHQTKKFLLRWLYLK
jgi:hypothetical protein